MQSKVFIILVGWNKWYLTEDCLKTLKEIHYDNYRVVVVDNGSDQQTKEAIKNSPLRQFFYFIENETNLGFAAGNNVGARYAFEQGADYLLLLNNDTVVDDKDFLNKLVNVAESDKSIGIVGPKIYYYDELVRQLNKEVPRPLDYAQGKQDSGQTFVPQAKVWFGGGKLNWLKTEATHLKLEKQTETDFITGCCLLIKREVIEKIGLLPEEFFLYFEDADWCLRAREAGYKCVYVPSAWIWHKVAASSGEFSYNYIYYNTRNGLLMAWRHALRIGGHALSGIEGQDDIFKKFLIILFSFWLLIKQLLKLMIGYKKEWSQAMLRGIWDFYRGKFGKM